MSVAALESPPVRLPVLAEPANAQQMPATRAGCAALPRPCPHQRCRYHLAGEQRGRVDAGMPSCVLDLASRGGMTLDEVGRALGLTRERIRQVEKKAIAKLAVLMRKAGLISPEEAARLPEAVRAVLNSNLVGRDRAGFVTFGNAQ